MTKILLPKKILLLYLLIVPLSCLFFLLYIEGEFWMFFSCLLVYFFQVSTLACLTEYPFIKRFVLSINVQNESELYKLDTKYQTIKFVAISIIILTIIIDTFPILACFDWFCNGGIGIYIPEYEGGILVSLMVIVAIFFLSSTIYEFNDFFKLPSKQYQQYIANEEERIKRIEKEKLQAKARHEEKVSLFGARYKEICAQFIFNETEKRIWLCGNEYSFDEILDAEIEDNTTQYISGGEVISETNTGNMIGRAIVGGILTGGVGAIIGGATAKKETYITPTEIHSEHHYNVLITLRDISNPLLTVSCNDNLRLAQKCLATLKAIIHNG